ncbi:hypothetical protein PFMALIP_05251 [Plasmodium falciparum MaliPS096_E11]|uniref:Transmembrane protein n=1 Tax=Plasmodium falciparum MaliPS096_E11 TaxID=1036727 RepID=A0A024WHS5_PLAFA|nr:hypothetical protein PFMALIP_05251 [Plasmodium falciparum MaliPS096_E11]
MNKNIFLNLSSSSLFFNYKVIQLGILTIFLFVKNNNILINRRLKNKSMLSFIFPLCMQFSFCDYVILVNAQFSLCYIKYYIRIVLELLIYYKQLCVNILQRRKINN